LLRIFEGELPQENRVDHAEDGGVGSDAGGQSKQAKPK
jgi:hypothetical protein